jgi:SAM-dependent methyltransferase
LKALVGGKSLLDAGAGSGASLKQFIDWPSLVVAADISTAIDSCREHFADRSNVMFLQADLTCLPLAERSFDVVWCNGVLHHTPGVLGSMRAVLRHLKPGGLFIFYIYKKKAPIREFVDDFVRDRVAALPPEHAWQRMAAITALGRSLARITTPLTIDEDVSELGIRKGTYDLQRFFYYHVLKCYWNDGMSFDDNVHVNFDWYHPRYAHRHDPAEVREWLKELGLIERSFRVSDSGIGVVAEKAPV